MWNHSASCMWRKRPHAAISWHSTAHLSGASVGWITSQRRNISPTGEVLYRRLGLLGSYAGRYSWFQENVSSDSGQSAVQPSWSHSPLFRRWGNSERGGSRFGRDHTGPTAAATSTGTEAGVVPLRFTGRGPWFLPQALRATIGPSSCGRQAIQVVHMRSLAGLPRASSAKATRRNSRQVS